MDYYDSDSEDGDFKRIAEATYRRMAEKMEKIGYAEGTSDGTDEAAKICYDTGYVDGFRMSLHVEKFKAFFKLLDDKRYKNHPNLAPYLEEKAAFEAMQVPDCESKDHCQILKHPNPNDIPSVSSRQRSYIDEFVQKCAEQIPLTSQLFHCEPPPDTNEEDQKTEDCMGETTQEDSGAQTSQLADKKEE